jgi:hypothetical protein
MRAVRVQARQRPAIHGDAVLALQRRRCAVRATTAEIQQWVDWYEAGMTARQIAATAGRAHKTIISALSCAGVRIRGRNDYPRIAPRREPDVWEEGWCDECCEPRLLNTRTGWCSDCSSELRRPIPTPPIAARRQVECGPGSSHSPALAATSYEEATTMLHPTPIGTSRGARPHD